MKIQKWISGLCCLLAATTLMLRPTQAQSPDNAIKVLELLKRGSGSCSINLHANGTISTNHGTPNSEFVMLWVYTLEGCGGGNNWSATASAYYIKQPFKGRAVVKEIPLAKGVVENVTFSQVRSVSFKDDERKSGAAATSSVEIDGLSMGEDDARCCPTSGSRTRLWIEDGRIKSQVIKTWKENKS